MVWNLFQVSTALIFPFFWGEKTQLFFYLFFFDRFINRDGIDFSDAQGMQAIQVVPPLFLSRHLLFSSNFKLYETFVFIVSRSGIWLKICKECWNTRQGNLFFLRFLLIYIILHCHCLETSFHLYWEARARQSVVSLINNLDTKTWILFSFCSNADCQVDVIRTYV